MSESASLAGPEAGIEPEALLEARGLTRSFKGPQGALTVLDGVDVVLNRGEMAALLGVSGAGKSTLIQILGGLDAPTAGRVLLEGQDLFKLSESQRARLRNRRISFVYQAHRLLPEFTALENVMMPLLIGRRPRAECRGRAEAILTEVGLANRLDHKPGQLSGGEQQRAAIARAVVTEPALLLADEPTGNLDMRTAEGVFELLLRLNREKGLTGMMVTHNPDLANRLHRRLHLVEGRVEEPDRMMGEAGEAGQAGSTAEIHRAAAGRSSDSEPDAAPTSVES